MRNLLKTLVKLPQNLWFALQYLPLKKQRKIIYALTPPPSLRNVGDQAQAIAINAWLKKHFPHLPVIEVNKVESQDLLPALKWLMQPDDLIFLHSGGNLGDRGIWSENIRRAVIQSFPQNSIVSLPQTIYFSDTPKGRQEQEKTRQIYASHPNLTVMGRDPRSGELATELFPKAQILCMPDFVLSMTPHLKPKPVKVPELLLCLRLDDESALTAEQRQMIGNQLGYRCTYYDTTLADPISRAQRENILEETLNLFQSVDAVVTDRYHGLIFAVLCRKPCVVLRTVDHKLTSAMHWFKEVPFIRFAQDLNEIPAAVESVLRVSSREVPDWNARYFDRIPELIGLKSAIDQSTTPARFSQVA